MNTANVIILYGPMAAGKLTVGKLLSEKLGYKLSHNHLINDLAWSLYDRNTYEGDQFIEELRLRFVTEVAKSGIAMVITHAYAHDFVSMTGLSDPEYMRMLEAVFKQHSNTALFVHLKASKEALLARVDDPSRSEFRKLTDKKIMQDYLDTKDFDTAAPVQNNLIIDTSLLSPEETVAEIIQAVSHAS